MTTRPRKMVQLWLELGFLEAVLLHMSYINVNRSGRLEAGRSGVMEPTP